ncbi:hypothetical protein [Microbacterium sp. CFBP9034]|uniref:hypothetical protein n=1 Tax=Microbacterium sp. CFBP9034 TaxID=3096540 RepID=UPI002A6B7484|nr:hypothetical protein [Microbacterium sp. CFBP9034]MDY0908578.1 hypothetical protein [Microbacterium sp. CFBP9034]
MTLEVPGFAGRRISPRPGVLRTLKDLPIRRPEAPAPDDARVRWELVDIDRYQVRCGEKTTGFIDVVGAVFVALAGPRYSRAVEVLQTLDFETAIAAVTPAQDRAADAARARRESPRKGA